MSTLSSRPSIVTLSAGLRRVHAESAANSLRGEILDLIHGHGAFAPLTQAQRREQLQEFSINLEPDRNAADEHAEFSVGTALRDEIESYDEFERASRFADDIAEEPERFDGME